jgi:hypothetical protein
VNLTTKNWMRVRLNTTKKTITFTNDATFKTKAECDTTVKSNQYISVNLKAYNKLLSEGYSLVSNDNKVADTVQKTAVVKEEWTPQYIVGDAKIEEEIRLYYIAKKAKQEANQRAIENFLTPVPQPKQRVEIDMSKAVNKYYSKQAKRNMLDKQAQIDDYCRQ